MEEGHARHPNAVRIRRVDPDAAEPPSVGRLRRGERAVWWQPGKGVSTDLRDVEALEHAIRWGKSSGLGGNHVHAKWIRRRDRETDAPLPGRGGRQAVGDAGPGLAAVGREVCDRTQ